MAWNERFHQFMLSINFHRSSADHCLYTCFENNVICYILLYVDDLLLISDYLKRIQDIKYTFSRQFEMTDIGGIDTFLEIHIERDRQNGNFCMSQSRYLKNVLCKFVTENCRPIHTPMETILNLQKGDINQQLDIPYRQ